jgi:RNA polymerase sigma-70 factor (ECF subfamily)
MRTRWAGAIAFPLTSWSLIAHAVAGGDTRGREAVETLLRRYSPALRARLVIDRRIAEDRAEDLLQGFFADRFLERRLLTHVDRAHGRFRTFILTALDNYVADVRRREGAKVRTPASTPQDIDEVSEPAGDGGSSAAFDRAWGRQVVAHAVEIMRRECSEKGRDDLWGVFDARILTPALEGSKPMSYEALVAQFALKSPEYASNILMTGKRMFARALCAVIGEYAEDDSDLREELAELRSALAGAGNGALPRI